MERGRRGREEDGKERELWGGKEGRREGLKEGTGVGGREIPFSFFKAPNLS